MKEEDLIRKKCGSKDPFRVPEGYFENFTSELMDRLPERPAMQVARPKRRIFRFAKYAAAAVLCGIAVAGTFRLTQRAAPDHTAAYTAGITTGENPDSDMDDYLDYAMVSNQEIAQYLTEAY